MQERGKGKGVEQILPLFGKRGEVAPSQQVTLEKKEGGKSSRIFTFAGGGGKG